MLLSHQSITQVIPRRGAAAAAMASGGGTNSGGGNAPAVSPATASVGNGPNLPPFDPGLPTPASTASEKQYASAPAVSLPAKPSSAVPAVAPSGTQHQPSSSVHSVPVLGPVSTTAAVAPTSPPAVVHGGASRPSAVATMGVPTVSAVPHRHSTTTPIAMATVAPIFYTPAVSETLAAGTTTASGSAGTFVVDPMQQEQLMHMLTPPSQHHTSPPVPGSVVTHHSNQTGPLNQWQKGGGVTKGANGNSTTGKGHTRLGGSAGGAGPGRDSDPGFGATAHLQQQILGPTEVTEAQAVSNRARRTSNNIPVLPPVSLATSGQEDGREGGVDGGAPLATPHGMPSDHDMANTAAALAMLSGAGGDAALAGIPGYDPATMGVWGAGGGVVPPVTRPKASSLKGVLMKQKQKKMMASGQYDMAGQYGMDLDPYGMGVGSLGMGAAMPGMWGQPMTASAEQEGKQGQSASGGPASALQAGLAAGVTTGGYPATPFPGAAVGAPGVMVSEGVAAARAAAMAAAAAAGAGAIPGSTTAVPAAAAAVLPVVDPYTGATTGLTAAPVPVVAIAGGWQGERKACLFEACLQ
jgi:hypothetical protein